MQHSHLQVNYYHLLLVTLSDSFVAKCMRLPCLAEMVPLSHQTAMPRDPVWLALPSPPHYLAWLHCTVLQSLAIFHRGGRRTRKHALLYDLAPPQ